MFRAAADRKAVVQADRADAGKDAAPSPRALSRGNQATAAEARSGNMIRDDRQIFEMTRRLSQTAIDPTAARAAIGAVRGQLTPAPWSMGKKMTAACVAAAV